MVKALTSTVILTLACLAWSVYGLFKETISSNLTDDQIKSSAFEHAIESRNGRGLPLQAADDRHSSRLTSVASSNPVESSEPVANVPSIVHVHSTQAPVPVPPPVTHSSMANSLNVNARAVREVFAEDVLARRTANGRTAAKLAEGDDYAN